MVIISPKLWPWALLILIKTLSLDIEGEAAGTSCYLGEDLDVLNNIIANSVIREEGFYLLRDKIPCDGRLTSIELCGVISGSHSTVNNSRVYMYAALYKQHMADGTYSLERITEPERLQSSFRESDIVQFDSGVICTRLSLVDYNWTALEGNILGVSFDNSSCEVQTFGTYSRQTCPLYAAVHTSISSDIIYIKDTVDTICNSSIQLEDLSNITGVKINYRVIVEPLPLLFSKVCDSQKKEARNPSKSESVIMDPPEEQIFAGSGTYIMNEELKCSGVVTSVYYCGAMMDERELFPIPAGYIFILLHLRLLGDRYNIINRETVIFDEANTNLTSIWHCQSHAISGMLALQGDQFGAIIFAHCERGRYSESRRNYYCPIQIGLNDTGCTDTSLFVTDLVDYSREPDSILKNNTSKVAIKLNFKVHYDNIIDDECQNHNHLYIIYGISVAFIVIIVLLVALSVVLMVRLKRTKPHIYDAISRGVRQGSTRLRNTLSRRNRNNSGTTQGFENRSFSEQNEYSSNYNHVLNAQSDSQQRGKKINLWIHHQASLLTGSYEEPIDAIDHNGQCDTEEDLYIDPPCKEKELKDQLQKLEVLKENIQVKEYLGSGRFGIVYRGLLIVTGVDSEDGVKEVAVKTMENGANEEERVKFLQEAAIMGQFNNPYIIKIYGAIITSQPYMIVCELMNKGDLRRYLHTLKISDAQDAGTDIGVILLNFSRQVASAMMYLSGKGFVHRDLAARNILVSMERICKVSDFGLSRDLHDDDYYVAHGGLIPVRWTAPEALKQRKYSTASDVWSYGIVLFEIWSLASRPYGTLTNEQVLRQVFAGYRLPSPAGCSRAVYNLMISCWHPEAAKRPTFAQLHTSLQQSDSVLLEWSEDERSKYSENARTIGMMYQDGEMLHRTLQKTYVVSGKQK